MSATDPEDPDTIEDDGDTGLGGETPEADTVEQRTDLRRQGDDEPTGIERGDADEADAAEQARAAGGDDDTDDYR